MFELKLGEFAAVGTALLWTLSAVAWTTAGRHVGALVVSFVRLLVATVLLAGHGLLFRGLVLPTDASYEQWRVLGLSGFLGFFLADLLLFKAFLMIGPRRSLLLYSLTPTAFEDDPFSFCMSADKKYIRHEGNGDHGEIYSYQGSSSDPLARTERKH